MAGRRLVHAMVALGCAGLTICAMASLAGAEPTAAQYVTGAGRKAKIVPPGRLVVAGRRMTCGRRPTVLDPDFVDFGGAYPGFVILNMKKMRRLPRAVQYYVFAHECGHQFRGPNEEAADCFAIKRGRRQGWLSAAGLSQICKFLRPLAGDNMHAPGTLRCEVMRQCYENAGHRKAKR